MFGKFNPISAHNFILTLPACFQPPKPPFTSGWSFEHEILRKKLGLVFAIRPRPHRSGINATKPFLLRPQNLFWFIGFAPKFQKLRIMQMPSACNATRLGDLLDFGQLFKCPNLLHFEAIFVKVLKSLIFLVESFLGNFYRHLATFYWSHCLHVTFY